MTLNELLLLLAVLVLLITPYLFMRRIKQPVSTYIRLTAGLFLLILVWFFAAGSSLPIKLLMTTIVVTSAIKTLKDYFDNARNAKAEKS